MRTLAEPAFPDDDGSVDPLLSTALSAYATDGSLVPLLQVLGGVRLLTPVVAIRGDEPAAGGDKEADMAAVLMTGADGRTALLAFSSLATLTAWDRAARPVPVLGALAAQAAVAETAAAIVLDVAGPVTAVVQEPDLGHLAAGDVLVRTPDGMAWAQLPG